MENLLFESKRLYFKVFDESDLMILHELISSDNVMKHCGGVLNVKQTKKWLTAIIEYYNVQGYDYFAVFETDTNEFVGQIGIIKETINGEVRDCLAYMIKESHWGKGFATEGASRCMDYAKNTLRIEALYATVDLNNKRSINVLEKLGFMFLHQSNEDEAILVYKRDLVE